MKTRARLTIWWALRTVERRGLTGKLDAKEGERDGKGVFLTTQLGVWGTSYKLVIGVRGGVPAENVFGE